MTPRPRVVTTLRMTLRAALVAAALAATVVAPATPSPAEDLGGVCMRAELTTGGHPQQALTLIAALRGTTTTPATQATQAADPHPTWCEPQRLGAPRPSGRHGPWSTMPPQVEAATGDPLTLRGVRACPPRGHEGTAQRQRGRRHLDDI